MMSVLLGAGFSKWAAGLPVASELFDFQVTPYGITEAKKLERVRQLREDWTNCHAKDLPEEFIADAMASDNTTRAAVSWYIVRRLSEPYIWQEWHAGRNRRHVLMIDEHRAVGRPGVAKAREFLSKSLGGRVVGILTTNYDMLVEYALTTRSFNYGRAGERLVGRGPYPVSQWRNPVILKGSIAVAKLHGSISWDAHSRYTDGRRGLSGNALIVAPTPEKVPPPALIEQWDLAARILSASPQVLVFGFAFNSYDQALLGHLHNAGTHLREVMLVDTASRVDAAKSVWPSATIHSALPPPEGQHQLSLWLREVDTWPGR